MTNQEIDKIIFRALKSEASIKEMEFLSEWIKNGQNREYFKNLKKIWHISHAPELTQKKKTEELHRYLGRIRRISRKKKIIKWSKYAAVLLLPLALSVYLSKVPDGKADFSVAPGVREALLIMSNGEKIILKEENTINIQVNKQVCIKSKGQDIIYENTETSMTDTAYNTLFTPRGCEYSIILSDGTKVYLNAESKLKYPVAFHGEKREVDLEGEGYFEVAHDSYHPFIVHINAVEIKVYGTKFNINAYKGYPAQTALTEGSIGIHIPQDDKEILLYPGEIAEYDNSSGSLSVTSVDTKLHTAWKDGKFVFDNEPIEKIMTRLSRWYNIDVVYSDDEIKKRTFTGIVTRYTEISTILKLLKETTLIDFRIENNSVIIK